MLDDTEQQHTDSATHLGITFDKKQTWKTHISRAETTTICKLDLLKKLTGTQWGAAETVFKNVYIVRIRPHLEYGSASKSAIYKLDKFQNQALRHITVSIKSTPIRVMEESITY